MRVGFLSFFITAASLIYTHAFAEEPTLQQTVDSYIEANDWTGLAQYIYNDLPPGIKESQEAELAMVNHYIESKSWAYLQDYFYRRLIGFEGIDAIASERAQKELSFERRGDKEALVRHLKNIESETASKVPEEEQIEDRENTELETEGSLRRDFEITLQTTSGTGDRGWFYIEPQIEKILSFYKKRGDSTSGLVKLRGILTKAAKASLEGPTEFDIRGALYE